MASVHLRSETHARGALTRAMRAVALSGPRVLRLAVVQHGRVVEERLLKRRARVTAGPTEKSLLVVLGLPREVTLFEPTASGYSLVSSAHVRGRVVNHGGARDVGADTGFIPLDDVSRGKLELGGVTVLFQMVAAPPVQPRPQLPVAVLRAERIDWRTTSIAAVSFLLHFLAVGALYSDFMDPILDDAVVVGSVIESLPVAPLVDTETSPANPTQGTPSNATRDPSRASERGTAKAPGPTRASREAALGQELERIELATLGALSPAGVATDGVLRNGELPTAALDAAARSEAGVSSGVPGRLSIRGGSRVTPGQDGSLTDLGVRGSSVALHETGEAERKLGPRGNAIPSPPTVTGTVLDAPNVVAGMRPGFRHCYMRGLEDYPDAQGRVNLAIRVGPGGEVQSVGASPSGNVPQSIVSCIAGRARQGVFQPPVGGSALVQVPVVLQLAR